METTCSKCGILKPKDQYYSSQPYNKTCKSCSRLAFKIYDVSRKHKKREYEKKNKQSIIKRHKETRINNKQKAVNYFGNVCVDCNQSFPLCVYDFHHLNPSEKEQNPARLLSYSWENILKELKKCIMLCSNCHRIRHFNNE